MKQILFLLLTALSFTAKAQDCSQTLTITAPDSLVFLVSSTAYGSDVKLAISTATYNFYDTVSHTIKITLTECQVTTIATAMSQQREGIYAYWNAKLRNLIVPFLPQHPSLYAWFSTFLSNNAASANQIIASGKADVINSKTIIENNQ